MWRRNVTPLNYLFVSFGAVGHLQGSNLEAQKSKSFKRAQRRKRISDDYKVRSILNSTPNPSHAKSLQKTASRLFKKAREEFRKGLDRPIKSQDPSTPATTERICFEAKSHFDKATNILQKAQAIQLAASNTATKKYQFVPEHAVSRIEKYKKLVVPNINKIGQDVERRHEELRPTPKTG